MKKMRFLGAMFLSLSVMTTSVLGNAPLFERVGSSSNPVEVLLEDQTKIGLTTYHYIKQHRERNYQSFSKGTRGFTKQEILSARQKTPDIKFIIDGIDKTNLIPKELKPIIINGRTHLPIRALEYIVTSSDVGLNYNTELGAAVVKVHKRDDYGRAKRRYYTPYMFFSENDPYDDLVMRQEISAFLENGRLYIPLRHFAAFTEKEIMYKDNTIFMSESLDNL